MKNLFMVLSLLCIATISINAQINVTVMIKRPTPALISDWQRDPLIVNVLTMNTSLESYENAVFSLKIRDESGRVVFQTENFDPLQPRFDFYRGASSNFNGTQIINLNAVKFDDAFKTRITTTNMIPEGDYEFCVEILDENGNSISSNGERCAFFSITIPDPPMLIAPFDKNNVQPNSFPQFIWTPVTNIPPGLVLKYHLMVVPVYEGQNRRYALESNQLLLDKIIQTSSYQYLPSDKSFSLFPDAVGFAWQVEALDQWNNPATRNEGKSEIGYFSFAEQQDKNLTSSSIEDSVLINDSSNTSIVDSMIIIDNTTPLYLSGIIELPDSGELDFSSIGQIDKSINLNPFYKNISFGEITNVEVVDTTLITFESTIFQDSDSIAKVRYTGTNPESIPVKRPIRAECKNLKIIPCMNEEQGENTIMMGSVVIKKYGVTIQPCNQLLTLKMYKEHLYESIKISENNYMWIDKKETTPNRFLDDAITDNRANFCFSFSTIPNVPDNQYMFKIEYEYEGEVLEYTFPYKKRPFYGYDIFNQKYYWIIESGIIELQ